jgi:hypothetical protein
MKHTWLPCCRSCFALQLCRLRPGCCVYACLSSCCDSCLLGQITNVHACVGAGCSLFSGKVCVPAGVPWVLFRAANACKSPSAARIAAK